MSLEFDDVKKSINNHVGIIIAIIAFLLVIMHFINYYPIEWDSAEYAWAVKSNYLPHSPYFFYIFMGKLLSLFLEPAISLTIISSISGILSLVTLYLINVTLIKQESGPKIKLDAKIISLASTLLLASTFLFIFYATIQEVYTFQSVLIFIAILLLLYDKNLLSGIIFGVAICAHNSCIFVLPGLLYLIYIRYGKDMIHHLIEWILSIIFLCSIIYIVGYVLYPGENGLSKLINYLAYLRGIAPAVSLNLLLNSNLLIMSVQNLYGRIFDINIIGLSYFAVLLMIIGIFYIIYTKDRAGIFWVIYCLPYLIYEILVGQNLDYGLYIPFLLPTLYIIIAMGLKVLSIALLVGLFKNMDGIIIFIICITVLILPNYINIYSHWDDTKNYTIKSSPTIRAAIWMSQNTNKSAFIIQPISETNVNLIPYYSDRRPIIREYEQMFVFIDRGKYTPLNLNSYQLLTPEILKSIINNGDEVFSYEKDPFCNMNWSYDQKKWFTCEPAYIIDDKSLEPNYDKISAREAIIIYKVELSS